MKWAFLRWVLGVAMVPACWGFARAFADAVVAAAGGAGFSAEALSLLGGMAAFALSWTAISHPVRAYVLGHELTHALWGLLFGARPSDVRVSESGGSVKLTRSNFVITLAPYFFPFYTFVVIIAALVTSAFMRPLPCMPLWMFLVGFTWAFHVLFTIETLAHRQPDVKLYGRMFSWTFIFMANVALVMLWLASTSSLTFGEAGGFLVRRVADAYTGVFAFALRGARRAASLFGGR